MCRFELAEQTLGQVRARRELALELGREPTRTELAYVLDITVDQVLELQRNAREPLSLDQTIGDEGGGQIGDLIEDSQAVVAARHPARCSPLRDYLD